MCVPSGVRACVSYSCVWLEAENKRVSGLDIRLVGPVARGPVDLKTY